MTTGPVRARTRADACPGALRPHLAADGAMVRLRVPGGVVPAVALSALADLSDRHGDGAVHLTSRGNLQLRGLRPVGDGLDPGVVQAIQDAGLLPYPSHELVRNVLASPWSGRRGGAVDVRPVVAELDAALCAVADLAALPGRFLFAVDDGTADVVGSGADVAWWAEWTSATAGADSPGRIVVAGRDVGVRLPLRRCVSALLAVARAFLDRRTADGAWRIGELGDGPDWVRSLLLASEPVVEVVAPEEVPPPWPGLPELGKLQQRDGGLALAALVPLGRLSSSTVRALSAAAVAAAPASAIVVTPWRELIVPDLRPGAATEQAATLSRHGLELSVDSPWRGVSACAGRPGCAQALVDVRELARRSVADRAGSPVAGSAPEPLHFSGCERRCGRPAGPHREIVATSGGLLDTVVPPTEPTTPTRTS